LEVFLNEGQVVPVVITDEIKTSFINYAMSVIVDRALPDVRDGLKPVQRRILYAMQQEGLFSNRKYSKSAGVVGEVIKKYPPARRRLDLRRDGADGAGLVVALQAGRRSGQFRFDRRRPGGGLPLHRSAYDGGRRNHPADIDKETGRL
jgi:hypothetical protein